MLDTGGRLHTDESLMKELREVKSVAKPQEILLVVDALTGQDAVRVAQDFHAHLCLMIGLQLYLIIILIIVLSVI